MKSFRVNNLSYQHVGPLQWSLHARQCLGVYGESGCGKSLLLRALADLDPHQGEVWLDESEAQGVKPHVWRKRVGLLASQSQWWYDRVADHFQDLQASQLSALGFDSRATGWQVSRLSSGEKQRLALLRLLENQPQVLLLDEPTANLDNESTQLFEAYVLDYLQRQQACAIWVSHDTRQLHRLCQAVYELKDGQLELRRC